MPSILITILLLTLSDVEVLQGKVIQIADGDTLTLVVGTEQVKVRLEGIDCPEAKQAFGNRAKQALSDLVHGKDVTVTKTGTDRYKRTLGVGTAVFLLCVGTAFLLSSRSEIQLPTATPLLSGDEIVVSAREGQY